MNAQFEDKALARRRHLQRLRDFGGAPAAFWPLLTEAVAQCLEAELVVLYVSAPGQDATASSDVWLQLAHWPAVAADRLPALTESVEPGLLAEARALGVAYGASKVGSWQMGLLGLTAEGGSRELMLVAHLGHASLPEVQARQWLAGFPAAPVLYEAQRHLQVSERDALRLAQAIEMLGRALESDSLDQAALVVANELAERFGCETVSLSWRSRTGLRLRALSHAEKPDRRSELSALLEDAGQEALSQGCEVSWPGTGKAVTRAHDQYAKLQHPGNILSVPLIKHGHPVENYGALVLERRRMEFSTAEQWALRMMADLLLPTLVALERRSRPLARRLFDEIRRSLPKALKPGSREGRQFLVGLGVAAGFLMLLPVPYFVEAGGTIKTDAMAFVGTPFDGYLESNRSSLGMPVKAGEVLFSMATRELILERASILADIAQFSREAEKRRSANQLPEMQISEAQANQAQARLQQVDYRLAHAQVTAPIDGVVVEGEPGKNLGGAVRRGEVVVKIAAMQQLYVEGAVLQRDLSRIEVGKSARLTLLADAGSSYDMRVVRIVPQASIKNGENTFPTRLETEQAPPSWWRPGMSGVAKIYVGFRPLIWIATHRLLDYLRLALWI